MQYEVSEHSHNPRFHLKAFKFETKQLIVLVMDLKVTVHPGLDLNSNPSLQ